MKIQKLPWFKDIKVVKAPLDFEVFELLRLDELNFFESGFLVLGRKISKFLRFELVR